MSHRGFRALGRNSRSRRIAPVFVGVLFAQLLAGCGASDTAPPPAASPSPGSGARGHGTHFYGGVRIGTGTYFGQAMFSRDGAVRLEMGGPNGSGDQVSAQFVGRVVVRSDQVTGTGRIIGQGCTGPDVNSYCRGSATGEMSGTFVAGGLHAEVRATNGDEEEVWVLDFFEHMLFVNGVPVASLAGSYIELVAAFAHDGDTIVNIDREGRLFFQSPGSGCIGNGALVARADSSFNLYDVTLTIETCNPTFAYLNGEFQGLAAPAADGWDYGTFLLQILLSTPEAAPAPTAIAMSGRTDL